MQDQEKVAAATTLRQAVEKQQPQEMLTWVNACRRPPYERIAQEQRLGQSAQRADRLQVEEAGRRGRPVSCMHLEEVMASKRTRRTAEWTRKNSSRLRALRVKTSQDRAPGKTTARVVAEEGTRNEK